MLTDIEAVVTKELSGLCGSCVHAEDCVYRKSSTKVVIQCEVFESVGEAGSVGNTSVKGLCTNCSKTHFCHLPREASGVWHCEEYE